MLSKFKMNEIAFELRHEDEAIRRQQRRRRCRGITTVKASTHKQQLLLAKLTGQPSLNFSFLTCREASAKISNLLNKGK